MIPKLIHVTWVQGDPPAKYAPYLKSWLQHNPDYELRIWNQDLFLEELHLDHLNGISFFPQYIVDHFHETARMSARMDIMRLYIMKKYGGVHIDIDMKCVNSIEKILGDNIQYPIMCRMQFSSKILEAALPPNPDCYFTISPPNHPMWDHAIDSTIKYINTGDITKLPAARALHDVYMDVKFRIDHHITLCPINAIVKSEDEVTDQTLAIHECHATWKDNFITASVIEVRDNPYIGGFLCFGILLIMIVIVTCVVLVIRRIVRSKITINV